MRWFHRFISSLPQHAQQARLPFRWKAAKSCLESWKEQSVLSKPNAPRCLLDLRHVAVDGEQGRRFHALVTLLERSGYELWLVPRLSFLQSGKKAFKQAAVSKTNFYESAAGPARFDLCLTDSTHSHPQADRTLRVSYDLSRDLQPGEIPLPYSFYPDVWTRREDARFATYRQRARQWRLFFGGYFQEKSYTKIRKYKRLSVVNRYEVITDLVSIFGDRVHVVDEQKRLSEMESTVSDGFVLIDSTKYRLDPIRWMDVLSRASFFVAAPGGDYPLSHNCIEALAIGTIPILQYGSLFHPALEDGVNCIQFDSRDELPSVAKRIDQMTELQIGELRRGCIEYFEQHLSPTSFRASIERQDTDGLHVFPYLTRKAS